MLLCQMECQISINSLRRELLTLEFYAGIFLNMGMHNAPDVLTRCYD